MKRIIATAAPPRIPHTGLANPACSAASPSGKYAMANQVEWPVDTCSAYDDESPNAAAGSHAPKRPQPSRRPKSQAPKIESAACSHTRIFSPGNTPASSTNAKSGLRNGDCGSASDGFPPHKYGFQNGHSPCSTMERYGCP